MGEPIHIRFQVSFSVMKIQAANHAKVTLNFKTRG